MAFDNLKFAREVNNQRMRLTENARMFGEQNTENWTLEKAINWNINKTQNVVNGLFEVEFFDLDGATLKQVFVEDGTDFPTPPTETPNYDPERLEFAGWTYMPEKVDASICVGALYRVKNGYSYLFVTSASNGSIKVNLQIASDTTLNIDWGDGTTNTLTSSDTLIEHIFAEKGKYVIKFDGSSFKFNATNYYNNAMPCTNCRIEKIYLGSNVFGNGVLYDRSYEILCLGVFDEVVDLNNKGISVYNENKLNISIPMNYTGQFISKYSQSSNTTQVSTNIKRVALCKTMSLPNFPSEPHFKNLYLPPFVEVKELSNMYYNCSNVKVVKIPEGIERVTIQQNISIEEIKLPSTIKSVDITRLPNLKKINLDMPLLTSISLGSSTSYGGFSSFGNVFKVPENCETFSMGEHYFKTVVLPSKLIKLSYFNFSHYVNENLIVNTLVIPTITSNNTYSISNPIFTIWVKDELLENIKVATNWAKYADYMRPLSEYEGDYYD